MRTGVTFFKLETKKYAKAVPVIWLESILFGLILIAFGAFAIKYVYGGKVINEMKVGVVSGEDERLSNMLMDFVGSMDSMKESCSFERMDEETAYERLRDGSIYAAVILPQGLVDSIVNGQNLPATIVFGSSHSQMETEVFRELAGAGGRLLRTAQAGIYATDELCLIMEEKDHIPEAENWLNKVYLQYALGRDSVFEPIEVQSTGSYNLMQYYCSAMILVFLSFAGLVLTGNSLNRTTAIGKVMAARGFGTGRQFLSDILAFVVVFSAAGVVTIVLFWQLIVRNADFAKISVTGILGALLVCAGLGLLIRLLVLITGNETAGMGICFLILLALMMGSGLFLPGAFLPSFVEKIGEYLPYRFLHEALLKAIC